MKKANRLITILIFIFLYIPMAVLIVASFNTGKDITHFSGFTLKQYAELFRDKDLLALLGNSVLVSVLASVSSQCTRLRYTSHQSSKLEASLIIPPMLRNSCW